MVRPSLKLKQGAFQPPTHAPRPCGDHHPAAGAGPTRQLAGWARAQPPAAGSRRGRSWPVGEPAIARPHMSTSAEADRNPRVPGAARHSGKPKGIEIDAAPKRSSRIKARPAVLGRECADPQRSGPAAAAVGPQVGLKQGQASGSAPLPTTASAWLFLAVSAGRSRSRHSGRSTRSGRSPASWRARSTPRSRDGRELGP